MHSLKRFPFLYVLFLTICWFPQMSDATENDSLRTNGTGWLNFGDAVIGSALRIELRLISGEKFKLDCHDRNFGAVQDWIKTRFTKKLNLSPSVPSHVARIAGTCFILRSKQSADDENILLIIPLNTKTMGINDSAIRIELDKPVSLMNK